MKDPKILLSGETRREFFKRAMVATATLARGSGISLARLSTPCYKSLLIGWKPAGPVYNAVNVLMEAVAGCCKPNEKQLHRGFGPIGYAPG
jgi:hypothetical protein